MNHVSEINKKIIKNTLFLYTRLLLVISINLYASRIILKALGAEDYGIFNIVGGIVAILGLMQVVIASAISRFFTFELGRNNHNKLNQYFKISIIIYVLISVIILTMAETIGLWFLQNKLIIPVDRISAALWVYQFSIFSFIATIMTAPYTAVIMARERMDVYAYIGIAEVVMKLIIVYLLLVVSYDKLKIYAALHFTTVILIYLINYTYCKINYKESKFSWFWSMPLFLEMIGYSLWSIFGAISSLARNQGMNILLGMFFNPIVNAARAIAYQVNEGINQFSNNFFAAMSPQITKKYAAGDHADMLYLVYRSTRISFYLLFILALPIMLETQYILNIWLLEPPNQSILFVRLVIFTSMIDSLGYPLMTAINAKGKIKLYQIITGGILILTLPIAYIFLKIGYPPESTMYVALLTSVAAQISRIIFMKKLHNFSLIKYLKEVIFVIIGVVILSTIAPFVVQNLLPYSNMKFIIVLGLSITSCMFVIYSIGITRTERKLINHLIMKQLKI